MNGVLHGFGPENLGSGSMFLLPVNSNDAVLPDAKAQLVFNRSFFCRASGTIENRIIL
jgi:hypothetical protein